MLTKNQHKDEGSYEDQIKKHFSEWKREYAINGHLLAEDLYRFLLMQTK